MYMLMILYTVYIMNHALMIGMECPICSRKRRIVDLVGAPVWVQMQCVLRRSSLLRKG